jgi:hypothetical protein
MLRTRKDEGVVAPPDQEGVDGGRWPASPDVRGTGVDGSDLVSYRQ